MVPGLLQVLLQGPAWMTGATLAQLGDGLIHNFESSSWVRTRQFPIWWQAIAAAVAQIKAATDHFAIVSRIGTVTGWNACRALHCWNFFSGAHGRRAFPVIHCWCGQ